MDLEELKRTYSVLKYVKYNKITGWIEATIICAHDAPPPWDDVLSLPPDTDVVDSMVDTVNLQIIPKPLMFTPGVNYEAPYSVSEIIGEAASRDRLRWVYVIMAVNLVAIFSLAAFLINKLG